MYTIPSGTLLYYYAALLAVNIDDAQVEQGSRPRRTSYTYQYDALLLLTPASGSTSGS